MKRTKTEEDPLAGPRDLTGRTFVRRGAAGKVSSPESVEPRNVKVHISIKLDADVLEHFKDRARQSGAAPYQTQINQALREAMERDLESFPGEGLVRDDRFVTAITERIKARL
jgi:uncharacterized protein (DUF4415 family)